MRKETVSVDDCYGGVGVSGTRTARRVDGPVLLSLGRSASSIRAAVSDHLLKPDA